MIKKKRKNKDELSVQINAFHSPSVALLIYQHFP